MNSDIASGVVALSVIGIPVHLCAICPLLSGISSEVTDIFFVIGIYSYTFHCFASCSSPQLAIGCV